MKKTIRCQEEVSISNRTYHPSTGKGEPYSHPDEEETHQCKLTAKYKINSINLYVCGVHAVGIDKKLLRKIRG